MLDPIIADGGREGKVMEAVKERKRDFTGTEHLVSPDSYVAAGPPTASSTREGDTAAAGEGQDTL